IGRLLLPADVGLLRSGGPVGLDIDRAGHAGAAHGLQELVDRVVSLGRVVVAEDTRLARALQPGEVRLAPDVMMGVDDLHATLRSNCRTSRQRLAALEPSASRSM